MQDEGIGGGHEGEGRQDDFVAGLHIEENGGHLEGVRAGGGQEGTRNVEALLEPALAAFRERPVAGDMTLLNGVFDIGKLVALETWTVEGNLWFVSHGLLIRRGRPGAGTSGGNSNRAQLAQ